MGRREIPHPPKNLNGKNAHLSEPWSRRLLRHPPPPFEINLVNLKRDVVRFHCVFIGEWHAQPVLGRSSERRVFHFDPVFTYKLAESSRSRRGVGAESSRICLFFVGQNGGVVTPPRSHRGVAVGGHVGINFRHGAERFMGQVFTIATSSAPVGQLHDGVCCRWPSGHKLSSRG